MRCGGVIIDSEIRELESYGCNTYFARDGQHLGLEAMINVLIKECDVSLIDEFQTLLEGLFAGDPKSLAVITAAIWSIGRAQRQRITAASSRQVPSRITDIAGSASLSLTDELRARIRSPCRQNPFASLQSTPTPGEWERTRRRSADAIYSQSFRSLSTPIARRAAASSPDYFSCKRRL